MWLPSGSPSWTASTLFRHLGSGLVGVEAAYMSKILERVASVRMFGNDVRKLCNELDDLWSEAAARGQTLDEKTKLLTLRSQILHHPDYLASFTNISEVAYNASYDHISNVLKGKQDYLELRPSVRTAHLATESGRNKRKPKPSHRLAYCHRCEERGHIAAHCTAPRPKSTSTSSARLATADPPAPAAPHSDE